MQSGEVAALGAEAQEEGPKAVVGGEDTPGTRCGVGPTGAGSGLARPVGRVSSTISDSAVGSLICSIPLVPSNSKFHAVGFIVIK